MSQLRLVRSRITNKHGYKFRKFSLSSAKEHDRGFALQGTACPTQETLDVAMVECGSSFVGYAKAQLSYACFPFTAADMFTAQEAARIIEQAIDSGEIDELRRTHE